ncbi:thiamine biosynthesis protein MoeB [Pontibacillus yanchengensis]|uniref:Thiamine biosynthesis protein MoeB n=2 Tax=Pontibacillus yanchengensis TaxID=462910 RepID=A0ACC7VAL4_9BACI|nr:MoeB/ThiF family adenylyltransferase [Pontibacillus yanchengensis]MYL34682.1 thiamine biosynthesis protein MoeB [Pontibacillus yanchengensis]MYL52333.1 thiamine biosynthesis protein MoeB [Pontibacillus yanchengensis]
MSTRYSRQERFKAIGVNGQKQIRDKHVLIVGAGALGSSNAEALVRAGIGKLTILDRDYVEENNLQRQTLYTEQDAEQRMPKAIAAKQHLHKLNSEVEIESHVTDLNVQNVQAFVEDVDLIIDGTDNFDTRFMLNDIAQWKTIPWIYGACVGSTGTIKTFIPGETPCLRCLLTHLPSHNRTCDISGIIGPAVQMVVAYQVAEALKIIVGDLDAVRKKLVYFDLWNNQHYEMGLTYAKNVQCLTCGENPTFPALSETNSTKVAVLCGRNTIQIRPPKMKTLNFDELERVFLQEGFPVSINPYLLSVKTHHRRMVFFRDGRVFIHGTNDISEAKNLYYRYLS